MPTSLPRLTTLPLVSALALAPLAACGDDGGAAAGTVTFRAANTALLAVREEGGDWRALQPDADGDVEVALAGPYTVASVCDSAPFFDYYTVQATPGDADVLDVWCADSVASIRVSVAGDQAGTIWIGFNQLVAGQPRAIPPGTYDVVAVDDSVEPPRIAIRRGVALTADTVVSVDLAAEGVAMNPVTVTAEGAGDDPTVTATRLTTAGLAIAWVSVVDGAGWLIPPSILEAGDRQRVSVSAFRGTTASRNASVLVDGDEAAVAVTLPAAGITAASRTLGAAPSVTWTSSAAWPERYFYLASPDFATLWDVFVLPGYADAVGEADTVTIPDPTELPGWDPAWNLTGAEGFDWSLGLTAATADGSVSANWEESSDAAARAVARPYLRARRAAAARVE